MAFSADKSAPYATVSQYKINPCYERNTLYSYDTTLAHDICFVAKGFLKIACIVEKTITLMVIVMISMWRYVLITNLKSFVGHPKYPFWQIQYTTTTGNSDSSMKSVN